MPLQFISAPILQYIIVGSQGRNSRQKLRQRPWENATYLAFFSWLAQLPFKMHTCPGIALPTVGWAFPHQSTNKKMTHRHIYRPIWWRQFINRDSMFSGRFLSSWEETTTNLKCLVPTPNLCWALQKGWVLICQSPNMCGKDRPSGEGTSQDKPGTVEDLKLKETRNWFKSPSLNGIKLLAPTSVSLL